ncbi:Serine/threonine-protein kinase PknJ [Planctomycetes bacterium CA13]|uniref:Serine/threonine-protein kinase PknJ n=1 Tax=Novipirellula herctigrandis TaxID=2527986 RepID=A0A5C5Z7T0_9BACT|nr:Serine/threonine-protein kinase PknJ [Planctomycetes bacterium CA13]
MPSGPKTQYQPGQEIVPGYTLVRPLGSGMAGSVWVARAAGGTNVALKVVPLEKLGGRKELSALRTLRNVRQPNLCPVHAFWTKDADGRLLADGETEAFNPETSSVFPTSTTPPPSGRSVSGTMAIDPGMPTLGAGQDERASKKPASGPKAEELIVVMGLGDCTLHDRLQQIRRDAGIPEDNIQIPCGLDAAETVRYLRASARAIDLLNQEHKIYHCDIKPQNILLVGGEAQVCDFGLAHKFEGDTRTTRQAFASPAYAAPEVLQGRTYSRSVDQYSLAITYFELRTGLLPFDITTEANITLAKCTGKLNLSHLTKSERKVLRRAMEIDPQRRYPSCGDFVDALALATGVDRRAGITPLRLAIASVVLATLVGGGLWSWRTFDRKSYDAFFGSDGTKMAAERLVEAEQSKAKYQWFEPGTPDNYLAALTPLRDAIKETQAAFPAAASDPALQQSIRQLTIDISEEFSKGILDQLYAGGLGDSNKYIQDDLKLLEQVYQDHPMPMLDPSSDEGAKLHAQVLAAKLQLAVQENEAADPTVTSAVRQLLEQQSNLIGSDAQQTLSAVSLALTHAEKEPEPGHYTETLTLTDIARAKDKIKQSGLDSLPQWCKDRWGPMEIAFLPELKQAYDTDNEKRLIIGRTWPAISVDADINKLKSAITDKHWDAARTIVSEFTEQHQDLRDDDVDRKIEVFSRMLDGIDHPSRIADTFVKLSRTLDQADSSERFFFKQPVKSFIADMTDRAMRGSGSIDEMVNLEFANIKTIHHEGQQLAKKLEIQPPASIDTLLLSSAVSAGTTPYADPEIQQAIRKESDSPTTPANAMLSAAIEIEMAAMDGNHFGGLKLSRLKQRLKEASSVATLPLPSHYFDYLDALIAWHDYDQSDAAQRWATLQSADDANTTARELGPARGEWIASMLLSYATELSGVDDDEILKQRFATKTDGIEQVEQAQWWLPKSPQVSQNVATAFEIQRLLVEVAEAVREGKTPATESTLARLQNLAHRLGDSIATGQTHRQDGQLYRAAMEVALANTNSQTADGKSADGLSSALRPCVAALDVGLGESEIYDRAWLDQILVPIMKIVRPLMTQPKTDSAYWEFPSTIDKNALIKFCEYFLKADGKIDMSQSDMSRQDWVDSLVMSAAVAANDESKSDQQQAELWLKTAEYAQQRHELSGEIWDQPKLAMLDGYLQQAKQHAPDNPEIAVRQAFLRYYLASLNSGSVSSIAELERAADELVPVIERLEESGSNQELLYDAYWRHANILIGAAFRGSSETREATLKEALRSAESACQMLEGANMAVSENAAFLSLGNSYEDLAFYVKSVSKDQRHSYYRKAIEAFQNAAGETKFGNPMKASFYLARCKYRYYLDGGPEELLENYDQVFGQFDASATPATQVEWLVWRSQFEQKQGRIGAASEDLEKAYEILNANESAIDNQVRNETIIAFAQLLNRDDGDRRRALTMLEQDLRDAEGLTYWKSLELQCQLLTGIALELGGAQRDEYFADLVDRVGRVPVERLEEIQQDAETACMLIARISLYVRNAGFPEKFGTPPRVDSTKTQQCLDPFTTKLKAAIGTDEKAIAYADFVAANAFALTDQSLGDRVKEYLRVLKNADPLDLNPELLHQMRLALLDQFHVLFFASQSRKREVPGILATSKQQIVGDDLLELRRQIGLLERNRDLRRLDEEDIAYVKQIYK